MENDLQIDELDFRVWVLLSQAHHAILRIREADLRDTDLTVAQAAILHIVKHIDITPTPANISRWLLREQHTIFSTLAYMEKKGLIKKVKDLEKKNMIRVVITEEGEEVYRQLRKKQVIISEIMSSLSDEEKALLDKCLRKVRDKAFEKLPQTPPLSYP